MADHDPDRMWVRDLRPGREVEELYAVVSKEVRQRRNGGPYLAMSLGDRTGRVAALAWENVDRFDQLCDVGSVVRVRGQVQRYNQNLQLVVRQAEAVDADVVDQRVFVRSSNRDPVELWQILMDEIAAVADPHLKQLLFRIFSNPEVAERFRVAPAARSMHHAFRSGLLEHTVSTAAATRLLATHYGLDVDLSVAGSLLHDLGKAWELEAEQTIEYTDDGRLIGHLTLAVLFVDDTISELERFPAELRRQLLHVLLAHHGEYEYGSPRRPKTPEAMLVHMTDNLDSKLAGMLEAMSDGGETEEAWTAYSPILGRHIYRRRPPTEKK